MTNNEIWGYSILTVGYFIFCALWPWYKHGKEMLKKKTKLEEEGVLSINSGH